MRRLITMTALLLALIAFPSVAFGLLGEDLKITDQGTTCTLTPDGLGVNCIGKYSGLGNNYGIVTITVTADYTCTNKAGNTVVGQSSGSSGPIEVHNGQVTFNVTTSSVGDKCEHADGHKATFTTATITIADQNGNVVRSFTYTVQQ
jgi:hypothetical protein